MKRTDVQAGGNRNKRWSPLYVALLVCAAAMLLATVMWVSGTQRASDDTINDLGKFYLEEIA